ncbi:hypothetical protein KIF24_11090 [Micromonospora sp. Llam7]|nr:hypothetical protein [Micromonospora tarapacensis]MBX7266525.1 hypothetical protein [Micromonospora tarapacensis]
MPGHQQQVGAGGTAAQQRDPDRWLPVELERPLRPVPREIPHRVVVGGQLVHLQRRPHRPGTARKAPDLAGNGPEDRVEYAVAGRRAGDRRSERRDVDREVQIQRPGHVVGAALRRQLVEKPQRFLPDAQVAAVRRGDGTARR